MDDAMIKNVAKARFGLVVCRGGDPCPLVIWDEDTLRTVVMRLRACMCKK